MATIKYDGEALILSTGRIQLFNPKIENYKKALHHFKNMPIDNFDFNQYMFCSKPNLTAWGFNPSTHREAEICFIENGAVPCGTIACVAGEIYLEFAKTKKERMLGSYKFPRLFLGANYEEANQLFLDPSTYTGRDESDVKLSHVIALFESIVGVTA